MRFPAIILILAACVFLLFPACKDNNSNKGTDGDSDVESENSSDGDSESYDIEAEDADHTEMEIVTDGDNEESELSEEYEAEPEDEVEKPDPSIVCGSLGLPSRPFDESGSGSVALYSIASDFTIETEAGAWNFKDNWSGCETYLFIQDKPAQTAGWNIPLWSRDAALLFSQLPANTHVFFVSYKTKYIDILEALNLIKTQVEEYLPTLDADAANDLVRRIHYVHAPAKELEGWLGKIMQTPGWGFGIDRFQKIRYIGSYADYSRYDSAKQWFAPNLRMAANEAVYYNYEAEREARLESRNDHIVTIFDNELLEDPSWSGAKGYADVNLPGLEEMAGFDSLELDLYLGCHGNGEFGTCPAWDYLVYLYLCDKEDSESCNLEFGRWITTYHREGRWVHDASAMLPLLAKGGARRFAFHTIQKYDVTLKLRFFNSGKTTRPYASTYLFSGGAFNTAYNDKYTPQIIAIPNDAIKIELATIISGHGMAMPGNCAEFCNTSHSFSVNGHENIIAFPLAGTNEGCMNMIKEGTIPNQYGTWWYGRSGWCPGKEVPIVMTDISDLVTTGEENTFEYSGLYNGNPYSVDGAEIRLESWLVFSK